MLMNYEKLALKIYKKACVGLEEDLKKFPLDQDMIKMFLGDFSDVLKIALLVENGKIKKALNHARNMDTAARDDIHEDFWKLQEKE
jgi:hypothetical protein